MSDKEIARAKSSTANVYGSASLKLAFREPEDNMRNCDLWKESKFVFHKGHWRHTKDPSELTPASRLIAQLVVEKYETYLPQWAHGRLGDFGCGKVPFYGIYRDRVSAIVCADWPQSLHANPHLDVYCDLNSGLPFRDGVFNCIILSDVLEHLATPSLALAEFNRVLCRGGVLVLNTPFFYWLHETPHDYYRYTEFALRHLLQQAGLSSVTVEALGGSPEIFCDFMAKHLARLPLCGRWLAAALCELALFLRRFSLWQNFSHTTAKAFPLGYFVVAQKS
ncbi:MAG: class I SAM-dependent methyltransferase [Candidatus Sumerlaeaceae bacterium]|nr:class I SAM-dependent methyltransferase [Candidatus Sumerlaeaceae bacterium]